jgi:hypothetical protein
MIKFNDGMVFDTRGELRIVEESDGLYVVGEGWLIPVSSRDAGKEMIEKMKGSNDRKLVFELDGPTGNAFSIMGRTILLLIRQGREDKVTDYLRKATKSDYDNFLKVTGKYVDLQIIKKAEDKDEEKE